MIAFIEHLKVGLIYGRTLFIIRPVVSDKDPFLMKHNVKGITLCFMVFLSETICGLSFFFMGVSYITTKCFMLRFFACPGLP